MLIIFFDSRLKYSHMKFNILIKSFSCRGGFWGQRVKIRALERPIELCRRFKNVDVMLISSLWTF
jgi:hypothetical protein